MPVNGGRMNMMSSSVDTKIWIYLMDNFLFIAKFLSRE